MQQEKEKDDDVPTVITIDAVEEDKDEEAQLMKVEWYITDIRVSQETIEKWLLDEIHMWKARPNTFRVYRDECNDLFLAARVKEVEKETEKDVVKHLRISETETGLYQIEGSDYWSNSIVELVESFVANHQPPLVPAIIISRGFAARMRGGPYWYDSPTWCCIFFTSCLWRCLCGCNTKYIWYNPKGKGLLPLLGLLIFYLILLPIMPCILCVLAVLYLRGFAAAMRDDYD